jgi:hypothetical protein
MISTYLLLSYTTNRTFVLSIGKKNQNKYRQILHFYFYKEISMTYLVRYSLRTEITSKDMITIPRRMYNILFSTLIVKRLKPNYFKVMGENPKSLKNN